MSLSADYYADKTADRCGGGGGAALAHQRKLIRGLLVWATLLTLGLGASITLHFIHRDSPAPRDERDNVKLLSWRTMNNVFIEGNETLRVMKDGDYFLYLQVTLLPEHKGNHTITLQSKKRKVILNGLIDGSKLSSVFMANSVSLNEGDILNVTCDPGAKIRGSQTETYLGVIKLNST
ncbi:tumor necrosis factor ligand superfamily member 18 [Garra rufa]|uniref:tumor necrosis factor ligand superfamily member 18 n=1 Tax=Garra rufa TaxID=137080 RepID=UPI003CCEEF73